MLYFRTPKKRKSSVPLFFGGGGTPGIVAKGRTDTTSSCGVRKIRGVKKFVTSSTEHDSFDLRLTFHCGECKRGIWRAVRVFKLALNWYMVAWIMALAARHREAVVQSVVTSSSGLRSHSSLSKHVGTWFSHKTAISQCCHRLLHSGGTRI